MAAMAVAKAARASRVLSRAWDEEETGRLHDSVSLGDQWGAEEGSKGREGDLGRPPASALPQTHPAGATSFLINEAYDSSQHSLRKDGTHKPFELPVTLSFCNSHR